MLGILAPLPLESEGKNRNKKLDNILGWGSSGMLTEPSGSIDAGVDALRNLLAVGNWKDVGTKSEAGVSAWLRKNVLKKKTQRGILELSFQEYWEISEDGEFGGDGFEVRLRNILQTIPKHKLKNQDILQNLSVIKDRNIFSVAQDVLFHGVNISRGDILARVNQVDVLGLSLDGIMAIATITSHRPNFTLSFYRNFTANRVSDFIRTESSTFINDPKVHENLSRLLLMFLEVHLTPQLRDTIVRSVDVNLRSKVDVGHIHLALLHCFGVDINVSSHLQCLDKVLCGNKEEHLEIACFLLTESVSTALNVFNVKAVPQVFHDRYISEPGEMLVIARDVLAHSRNPQLLLTILSFLNRLCGYGDEPEELGIHFSCVVASCIMEVPDPLFLRLLAHHSRPTSSHAWTAVQQLLGELEMQLENKTSTDARAIFSYEGDCPDIDISNVPAFIENVNSKSDSVVECIGCSCLELIKSLDEPLVSPCVWTDLEFAVLVGAMTEIDLNFMFGRYLSQINSKKMSVLRSFIKIVGEHSNSHAEAVEYIIEMLFSFSPPSLMELRTQIISRMCTFEYYVFGSSVNQMEEFNLMHEGFRFNDERFNDEVQI